MSETIQHLADFNLVERCLGNDANALAQLQQTYRVPVTAFLSSRGANSVEAQETVEMLWGDLLTPASTGRTPLSRYNGKCALLTYLNLVALNRLFGRKRVSGRYERRFPSSDAVEFAEPAGESSSKDEPLIELIRDAVEFGFQNCDAEDFVLVQLQYYDDLDRGDLARMFRCSESTIHRELESARSAVRKSALAYIRERDPWLELRWEDFIELCRTTTLTSLGAGED
ncbi:MAG: hypothetical protein ABIZ56_06995 [Chthoniobacteraceae bacterium]